ncbi:hypothetical protein ACLOJK_034379 [Asimina triloba]
MDDDNGEIVLRNCDVRALLSVSCASLILSLDLKRDACYACTKAAFATGRDGQLPIVKISFHTSCHRQGIGGNISRIISEMLRFRREDRVILLMDAGCLHRAIAVVEALPSAVKFRGNLKGFLKIRSAASAGAYNLPQDSKIRNLGTGLKP